MNRKTIETHIQQYMDNLSKNGASFTTKSVTHDFEIVEVDIEIKLQSEVSTVTFVSCVDGYVEFEVYSTEGLSDEMIAHTNTVTETLNQISEDILQRLKMYEECF